MRIEKLLIPAFGPFTDREFDFTGGHGKLEILYGRNEAGKTSLLRGVSAMLFGFHPQTPDDFLHPYKTLRIGATLEHQDKRLRFFRRKANKDSLLQADNLSVMLDEDLRAFVQVTQESFDVMFGLDGDRLALGGRELLEGRGEYGSTLFGAATGIVALREIQRQLDAAAESLFKPKASKSAIMKILAAREDARKRIRDAAFTAQDLKDLLARHEAAGSEKRRLDESLQRRSAEIARLERLRMAHPLLDKRRHCLEKVQELGQVALLREGFVGEFDAASKRRQDAASERARLEALVQSLQSSLSQLQFCAPLIEGKARISGLHQRFGAYLKAQQDLPKLTASLQTLRQKMSDLLAKLGEPPELDSAAALRVAAPDAASAAALIEKFAVLESSLIQAIKDEAQLRHDRDSAGAQLSDLREDRPDQALRQAHQAVLELAELDRQLPARLKKLGASRAKLLDDLAALPWKGSLSDLSRAPLPAASTLREWKTRLTDAGGDVKAKDHSVLDARKEFERCEAVLSRGKAARSLPGLPELQSSREHRQSGWRLIRGTWLGEPLDEAGSVQSGSAASEPRALASAYEGAVEKADRIADELREHADEVAQLAQAQADLDSARSRLAARTVEWETAKSAQAQMLAEWKALWAPHGLEAASPEHMVDWLSRRGRLLEDDARLTTEEEAAGVDSSRLKQVREDLAAALPPYTAEPLSPDLPLSALRIKAESLLVELQQVRDLRSSIQVRLRQSEASLAQAQLRIEALRRDQAEWRGQWDSLLGRLRLTPPVESAALKVILTLRADLAETCDQAAGITTRVTSIERDARAFEHDVRELCGLIAPDLQDHPATSAVEALQDRLHADIRTSERHKQLSRQLAEAQGSLASLGVEDAALQSLLSALVAEAGCSSLESLPASVQASAELRELQNSLRDLEGQLAAMTGGGTLDELARQAAEIPIDLIHRRIDTLRGESAVESASRDRALQDEAAAAAELDKLSAASDAAAAKADLEAANADLLESVEQYLRVAIAGHILRKSVEEYGSKSAAPLLARSSAIFSDLTRGSFRELHPDLEDNKPILVGVRPDGKTVALGGMSDGTRDQLYLALRIASLELFFDQHSPVPVILDDLLVHFDDERAGSALLVLANLARKTQVLLFTHHRHLLELASNTLSADSLSVYPLEATLAAG